MSRHLRDDSLRDSDDIFDLGLVNSMFAMQLVMFVEKEFSITVGDDDLSIDNFRSIDAITALVTTKVPKS